MNMENVEEAFAERELSPLDVEGLACIQAALEKLGVTAIRSGTGTLRAEVTRYGMKYILAHFVSGREVFYIDEHILEMRESPRPRRIDPHLEKLHSKQSVWLEEDGRGYLPLAKRIFVVDLDNLARDKQYSLFTQQLELDTYGAQKVICTLESLQETISSPFRPVAHRAFAEPFSHATRASIYDFDTPPPAYETLVNKHFEPRDWSVMCSRLSDRKNREAVMAVAARIFSRIMGSGYSLVFDEGTVEMVREGSTFSEFMIGRGEQTVMSFCVFLALAHDRVTEGMCIGIKESLNYLDEIRHIKAMTVLADFVIATGASVYVQTDKSDNLRFADKLLPEAAKIAAAGAKATLF